MKKKLTLIVFLLCSVSAFAQQIKLNGYASYVFDDNVSSYYSATSNFNGRINGGLLWGAGLEFMLRHNESLELSYLRQDTHAPIYYYDLGQQFTDFSLASNFILLGGTQYFGKPAGKIDGFLGWMAGVDIVDVKNPDNGYSDSATKFAWGFKGGADYWLSPQVAIKFQVQLLSAVQSAGGGFYFGTGGSGTVVTTASTMLQFGIGGGIVFKLNSGR